MFTKKQKGLKAICNIRRILHRTSEDFVFAVIDVSEDHTSNSKQLMNPTSNNMNGLEQLNEMSQGCQL